MRIIWERNDAEPTYRTAAVDEIYMDDSGQCYIICPITKLEHDCDEYGRWTDFSKDEYKDMVMKSWQESIGPTIIINDSTRFLRRLKDGTPALEVGADLIVDTVVSETLLNMPNALPGSKMETMDMKRRRWLRHFELIEEE